MSETKPSDTKPRKIVSRNVVVALGIICIIIVTGLGTYYTMYTIQTNVYNNYVSSHSHTDSEFDNLNVTYHGYMESHSYSNSVYDSLLAPRLFSVNLEGEDSRPLLDTPRLHIHGFVFNAGANTAYNCDLYVVAYQNGGFAAINTTVNLGSIIGWSYATVDSNITYQGSHLEAWSIVPEWRS